jgi:hypothetical protein
MKQLDVPNGMKVSINYNNETLPQSAHTLAPLLFKDGNSYCCVLGPDRHAGISGFGDTPVKALWEWDKNLKLRVLEHREGDDVAQFIINKVGNNSIH